MTYSGNMKIRLECNENPTEEYIEGAGVDFLSAVADLLKQYVSMWDGDRVYAGVLLGKLGELADSETDSVSEWDMNNPESAFTLKVIKL